jgi:FkbM family methyltransferase
MSQSPLSSFHHRLDRLERLAQGPKWKRLLANPLRYLLGIGYQRLVYARSGRGWQTQTTTFFGASLQVLLPAGMDLFLLGGKTHPSEIRLTRFFLNFLKPGDTLLDVGTHFGFYSSLGATLVGESGRVIGVEAAPGIYSIYTQNVASFPQVQPFHLAAGNQEGAVTFYQYPILYSEYNTLQPDQYAETAWSQSIQPEAVEVNVQPLQRLLTTLQAFPKLIKIDVEGAENLVVQGLTEFLNQHHPTIALEYILHDTSTSHQEAAAELLQLGYRPHLLDEAGYPQPIEDIEQALARQNRHSDNVLFIY